MQGRKLLVIDDDPEVVAFLCDSLLERGFRVEGQTSPDVALVRLGERAWDMVVTDLRMGDMRGIDALLALLSRRPTQLVLVMTAFGDIDLAVQAVRAGACDFIAKPFRIEALVAAIARAFEDREMRREVVRLREPQPAANAGDLVARSSAMKAVVERARRIADLDSTVLLTGETGTGKGAVARFIHETGARRGRPFHHVNCASLPATLVESELFGVRRGAFTDAREDRPGAFVAAADGTLFLDEIGELPLEAQATLLYALENGHVRPLGAHALVPVRARVLAATNRPLEDLLREGRFRPDLYYRLNVIRIDVPPLRERRDDLAPLVDVVLGRVSARQGEAVRGVSAAAMRRLMAYHWPGNVRELANTLERAVVLCEHDALLPEDLELPEREHPLDAMLGESTRGSLSLAQVEQAYVKRVLDSRGGNKAEAARVLGINRRTLYRMLFRSRGPAQGAGHES